MREFDGVRDTAVVSEAEINNDAITDEEAAQAAADAAGECGTSSSCGS